MKRDLLKLQRDIIQGAPKGCSPYDRYAYHAFSRTAQHLSYSAPSDEEREWCLWLKGVALKKANAMKEQEVSIDG